jgi:ankyrin repeat protein
MSFWLKEELKIVDLDVKKKFFFSMSSSSELFEACASGDISSLQLLLDGGVSVETRNDKGTPILVFSATKGHAKVLELLLERGADVHVQSSNGGTALHAAALSGVLSNAELLLRNGALVDAATLSGASPLVVAISSGHVPMAKFLVQAGADVNWKVMKADGLSVLSVAVQTDLPEMVEFLLERGARVNDKNFENTAPIHFCRSVQVAQMLLRCPGVEKDAVDVAGWTPLRMAVSENLLEVVKFFLNLGVLTDARANEDQSTPLHYACSQGFVEVAQTLVEHGADKNATSAKGFTPLTYAAQGGHVQVAVMLLKHGALVSPPSLPCSALHLAAQKGFTEMTQLLVQNGANLEYKDHQGATPLGLGAFFGQVGPCSVLIQAGARERGFALLIAVQQNHEALVRVMFDLGAEKEYRDPNGWNALHFAAYLGRVSILQLLLSRGAKLDQVTAKGLTALQLAKQQGCTEAARILMEWGARQ